MDFFPNRIHPLTYRDLKTRVLSWNSSFRHSRSILELESKRLALRVWKCHIDLESLKLEFHAKKILTYSGVFKSYSDVLKSYSDVFLQNFFYKYRFKESYSGIFKSYSDVLVTYSGVFIQFMEIESLKLDFQLDFFPLYRNPHTNRDLKTRFLSWNSSFRHSRC